MHYVVVVVVVVVVVCGGGVIETAEDPPPPAPTLRLRSAYYCRNGVKDQIIMVRFRVRVSRPRVLIIMPQKSVRVSRLFLIENLGLTSFDLFFTSGPSGPVFVPLPHPSRPPHSQLLIMSDCGHCVS